MISALLYPKSVAIVGQSDDASKTTGRPLRFLRQAGYAGAVYPVNPNRGTVLGERAWPSVEALPETPEHAYILTATELALDAVEACGRRGVAVATILASGFSEAGAEGRRREERLRSIVATTGIRVVGPSSLGVVNLHERLLLTANAAFAEPDLVPGSIFVASHSGSLIGAIVSRGKARGIRFAGLVSAGNEVDLGIGEICAATLDDPRIAGYVLFLETLRKAYALRDFAIAAADRGKPILAYKLGRSEAAAELTVSHTGALAGEDDVADEFLRDCGIARVHTLDALIEGLPLVSRIPIRRSDRRSPTRWGDSTPRSPIARVSVVTTTGGGAAMVVDQLGLRGIELARFVDLTLAGTKYDVMKAALDEQLAAPDVDLVIAVPGSSARYEPELAVRPVIDSAGSAKPLAAFVVPEAPDALAKLSEAGVPNFRTPEACADAVAAAFARRMPKKNQGVSSGTDPLISQRLDELQAYELLARMGIGHAPAEAIDGAAATTWVQYPVAVKALSAEIPHKSDVGGVVLGVRDARALKEAIERIHRDTGVERYLVQAMTEGLAEVLVGYRVHPQVGPIVLVAAGGVLAEVHRDRSLRLAPVDRAMAEEMIGEVRALEALRGYRGRPEGDLAALAEAIVKLSQLAAGGDPLVLEAELNPLIVLEKGRGVVAVDALVRVSS